MKTIKASEEKYLYDGQNFVKIITVATDADADNWKEVSQEFYDTKNPAPEPEVIEAEVVE